MTEDSLKQKDLGQLIKYPMNLMSNDGQQQWTNEEKYQL